MLIIRDREKLFNAIIFFAEKTLCCGKTKLFKLLSFLDFEHYRETGRSITGLDYYAWRLGPVPVKLDEEFDEPSEEFEGYIGVVAEQVYDHQRQKVIPKKQFDPSFFSRRELRLLDEIAARYKDYTAQQMIDATHRENIAWIKAFDEGRGYNNLIAYEDALRGENRDIVLKKAEEHQELLDNYS